MKTERNKEYGNERMYNEQEKEEGKKVKENK